MVWDEGRRCVVRGRFGVDGEGSAGEGWADGTGRVPAGLVTRVGRGVARRARGLRRWQWEGMVEVWQREGGERRRRRPR